MPRFWTRLVDSMPREMRSLTWRLPLVVITVVLCMFIFFPYQDTPFATKTVIDIYDTVKGSDELGKVRMQDRRELSHDVTDWWVWLTSPFHYEVERELWTWDGNRELSEEEESRVKSLLAEHSGEDVPIRELLTKGGRPGLLRKIEIRSRGLNLGLDLRGGTELLYRILMPEDSQDVTAEQIKQIIQTRIDAYGLREPRIQAQGSDRILVQLPGQEPSSLETIKSVIQNVGHLEFRLVASGDIEKRWKDSGETPADYTEYAIPSLKDGEVQMRKVLVSDKSEMTGENIASTRVNQSGQSMEIEVSLSFTPAGSQDFARVTRDNVKERLAIVLNTRRAGDKAILEKGICYSAPVIKGPIYGDASISGNFDVKEARALRTVLMAGSLPAPLRLEQENTVGATLGPALVGKGVQAIVIGLVLVVVFMAMYYWLAGAIANFALLLNILIIVSVLILFDATLTLPGIAGLLLTVGMAVDANVLIFERIREEQDATGEKPLRLAIRDGYGRAFMTIFDANVTTLFTAIILYSIGTGAVKGFGVVLTIGILTSMFTALVVTRVIFDILVWRRVITRLSMAQFIKNPHIAFMSLRNKFLAASCCLVIASLVFFGVRGEDNWDIDFRGGTLVHLVFNKDVGADQISKRLAEAGPEFNDAEVQTIAEAAGEGSERETFEFVIRFPSLSDVVVHSTKRDPGNPGGTLDLDITTAVPLTLEEVKTPLGLVGGYIVTPVGDADAKNRYTTFTLRNSTETPDDVDAIRAAVENALAEKKPEGADAILTAFKPGEVKYKFLAHLTAEIDSPVALAAIQEALEAEGGHWTVNPVGAENESGRYMAFRIDSTIASTTTATTRVERAFATQTLSARVKDIFAAELAPEGIVAGAEKDGKTTLTLNFTRGVAADTLETQLGPGAWDIDAQLVAVPESASDDGFTQFAATVDSVRANELTERLLGDPETFPLSEPIPRVAKVGPAVAREMLIWAVLAIAAASVIIIAYVWLRFERLKYGFAAVAALVHDVLITIGILCLFGVRFNLPIVAALLTIIGYSINDTIVVFDRIRENLRKHRKRDVDAATIDESINQVIGRTILTSATTLLAVLSLLLFAGGVIQDFALALFFGVFIGTYSSIFIASPLLILHQERVEKRLRRS
ncbi:protein translocase subunit SecD [bacterium]|nr:protein translocase subunit SecD [bacterium]